MPRQKLRSQKSSISTRKSDTTHEVVVSAAELGEVVGIDLETVNNWLRRGVIRRASVGGRRRLFSRDEVYKAALTNELVKLGNAPSAANDAVNELWKEWKQVKFQDGGNIYAVVFPNRSAVLYWQMRSGGPLLRQSRSSGAHSAKFDLPRRAFAVVPISHVVADVTKRLARLPRQ
jgi:excisionase family DNA binding protein